MKNQFLILLKNSKHSVSYMVKGISHVCRNISKRDPGSIGERDAAKYMANILKDECGCSFVKTEKYCAHPAAFYGYFFFAAILNILCALSFFLQAWLSILFGVCSLLLFILQFVFYKQVIDPLFPTKAGLNVTAIKPCEREIRRRLLLNGHIDAAWEFPLNYYFGGVIFEIPGVIAVVGVFYYLTLSVISLLTSEHWTYNAALYGLIFIPFFILVALTYNPRRIVDGANDNLSGCYMGISLLREMKINNIVLENTEVGVILTGSEEAGLRGAKAWSEKHKSDFLDVPTYIVTFDTIHDPQFLTVNERDLNGTVVSDRGLRDAFLRAAKKANVPCKNGWVPLFGGATDSAAFTQGGFRSIGVTGLNHKLESYYHTRRDTCDNLDVIGLENCYKATVLLLEAIDEGQLD